MNTKTKIVESIRSHTPYLAWAQAGLTPDQIKNEMRSVLRPYLRNSAVLDALPLTVLAHEAVAVNALVSINWTGSAFTTLLGEFHRAFSKDADAAVAAARAWNGEIVRSASEFISLYLLELDKRDLPIDEMRVELFRNIGGLVEACIQPHLRAAWHLIGVGRGLQVNRPELELRSLGAVVEDFARLPAFSELMAPAPWGIKLNQWRNIAQHHSTAIVDGRVICRYRVGRVLHQCELSREDALAVARALQMVLGTLRAARSLFVLDREIECASDQETRTRHEAYLLEFCAAIATQGFEVVEVEVSGEIAHLRVKDVTDQDPKARAIHASQFVVGTWAHYQRRIVRVTFTDRGGGNRFEATVDGEVCRKIVDEELPFESLADAVAFRVPLCPEPGIEA